MLDRISSFKSIRVDGSVKPFPPGGTYLFRFFDRLGTLLDDEGRPLHEGEARTRADGCPIEFRVCPYSGSRKGAMINASALRQLGRHWHAVLASVVCIRRKYLQTYSRDVAGQEDVLRIALALSYAPPYLFRRCRERLSSGQLPAFIGGTFKASLDVITTIVLLVIGNMSRDEYDPCKPISLNDVIDCAERDGLYLNGQFACSGSPRQVNDFVSALLTGQPCPPVLDTGLSSIIGSFGAFFRYCDVMTKQYLVGVLFYIKVQLMMRELAQQLCGVPLVPRMRPSYPDMIGYLYQRELIIDLLRAPHVYERVVSAIAALTDQLNVDGAQADYSALFCRDPSVEIRNDHLTAIWRLLAAAPATSQLPGERLTATARLLLSYFYFEQRVLTLLGRIRGDVLRALDCPSEPGLAHTSEILEALTTPRDVLAELLQMSIPFEPGKIRIVGGDATIEIGWELR